MTSEDATKDNGIEEQFERHFGEERKSLLYAFLLKFKKFQDKYFWQVLCLMMVVWLLYQQINNRLIAESMIFTKCQNIFAMTCYDIMGNLKMKNLINSTTKNVINLTNLTE